MAGSVSSKSLRVSLLGLGTHPAPLRMTRTCVSAPNMTGVLDYIPRVLGDCRGAQKKKKKIPANYAANKHGAGGEPPTTRTGQPEWICVKRNLFAYL